LGTEFTYQGQLNQNGVPVNGSANLRFSLWTQMLGGVQVGGFQIVSSITVTNGIFTVQLNGANQFGATAFSGDARYIQVDVCSDATCSSFTTLLPRQPITATPYARFSAAPWETNGNNVSVPAGKSVGIGTSGAQGPLDVLSGNGSYLRVDSLNGDLRVNGGVDGFFGLFNEGVASGATQFISQGAVRLAIQNTGNVGVGTPLPAAKLDVRGDIKLGANGQHFATGSEENLRIVRGIVDIEAGEPYGCCFSVERPLTGAYDITFTTPFSGVPAVTATADVALGAVAHIVQPTASIVRVVFKDYDGVTVNSGFHFIAVGPR
jgi:hypothetical protein